MTHPHILTRRSLLSAAALAGAGALLPGDLWAQEGPAAAPEAAFPWAGEELYYKVKINGAEAVHAALRLGQPRTLKGDIPYVPLAATIKSVGLFHSVYPMNDRANTFIHATTLQPLRSEKLIQEAGKERVYNVDYKVSEYAAHVQQIRDKTPRSYITPVPSSIHDAFTWFLHLRRRDDLAIGLKLDYYIYDGWKLSRVALHVVAEESVLTPLGWVKSWKLDLEREILRSAFDMTDATSKDRAARPPILKVITPAKPTGALWISQDARRLPVKIKMESTIGTGVVELARHIPAAPAP